MSEIVLNQSDAKRLQGGTAYGLSNDEAAELIIKLDYPKSRIQVSFKQVFEHVQVSVKGAAPASALKTAPGAKVQLVSAWDAPGVFNGTFFVDGGVESSWSITVAVADGLSSVDADPVLPRFYANMAERALRAAETEHNG